jgi:hypothetical protein
LTQGVTLSTTTSIDWCSMLEKVARSRCMTLCGGTPNQRQISSTWCWRVSMNWLSFGLVGSG